jgi:PIN domain nuclease of toxin-antitoxin system
LAINGFVLLAIDLRHATRVAALPFHHRDPFDRLLAAQAIEETLTVVSADAIFGKYGVARIW